MLLAERQKAKITMTKKMKLEGTLALSCLSSVLFFVFVLAFPDKALFVREWLLKTAGN